jgi:hypothetical protein
MFTNTPNANSIDMPIQAQPDSVTPTSGSVMIDCSGGAPMTRLERLKAATTELTVAASEFYWKAYSDGGMPDAEFEAAVGLLGVAKAGAKKHLNLLLQGQLECAPTFPCAFNEPGVTPPNTVVFGPVPEEVAVEQRAMVKRIQMMDLSPNTTLSFREEKHEDGSVTFYITLVPKAAPAPAVNPIGKTDPSRAEDDGEGDGDEDWAEEEGAEEVVRYRIADGAPPKPVIPNQRSHGKSSGSIRKGERYERHRETGKVLGATGSRPGVSQNRERSQDHRKHTTSSLVLSRAL